MWQAMLRTPSPAAKSLTASVRCFALGARGRRDEADGALHGGNVGVVFAFVGGEDGDHA